MHLAVPQQADAARSTGGSDEARRVFASAVSVRRDHHRFSRARWGSLEQRVGLGASLGASTSRSRVIEAAEAGPSRVLSCARWDWEAGRRLSRRRRVTRRLDAGRGGGPSLPGLQCARESAAETGESVDINMT